MGKKIVVITGSPRAKGNSNSLAAAFASGAIAQGNEVEFYDTTKVKLGGFGGEECKADREKLDSLMRWADVMVLVSPLYWKGFSAQIKLAIDGFAKYLSIEGKNELNVTEAALIATGKSPDGFSFYPMVEEYKHIVEMLGLENRFTLLCPCLNGVGDVEKHPFLIETAVKYGMEI